MRQIAENRHRADLSDDERRQQIAEWARFATAAAEFIGNLARFGVSLTATADGRIQARPGSLVTDADREVLRTHKARSWPLWLAMLRRFDDFLLCQPHRALTGKPPMTATDAATRLAGLTCS